MTTNIIGWEPGVIKDDMVQRMEGAGTFEGTGEEAWEAIKPVVAEMLAIIEEYSHALHHVETCDNNAACANCVGLAKAALYNQPNVADLKAQMLADFDAHEVNWDTDEEEDED